MEKKGGLKNFLAHVIDHPELLETVPHLPRKEGTPDIFNHPDLRPTMPYFLEPKKKGTCPNPELLATMEKSYAERRKAAA